MLGNGAVIHIPQLMAEVAKYENIGLHDRLLISNRAHLGMCYKLFYNYICMHEV